METLENLEHDILHKEVKKEQPEMADAIWLSTDYYEMLMDWQKQRIQKQYQH